MRTAIQRGTTEKRIKKQATKQKNKKTKDKNRQQKQTLPCFECRQIENIHFLSYGKLLVNIQILCVGGGFQFVGGCFVFSASDFFLRPFPGSYKSLGKKRKKEGGGGGLRGKTLTKRQIGKRKRTGKKKKK